MGVVSRKCVLGLSWDLEAEAVFKIFLGIGVSGSLEDTWVVENFRLGYGATTLWDMRSPLSRTRQPGNPRDGNVQNPQWLQMVGRLLPSATCHQSFLQLGIVCSILPKALGGGVCAWCCLQGLCALSSQRPPHILVKVRGQPRSFGKHA